MNSSNSSNSSGSTAVANGGLGPRVARTMRAARAGALIGLRGVAPTLVGHAALQLVMHAGLHAAHGLLPPQRYLQCISSVSKSMHWAAVVSPSVITMATVASIFCAQRRELRRLRKEAKEVQRMPLAERDARVAELKLRYDALLQIYCDFCAQGLLALTSCSVFETPGLRSRWRQTRWWDELRSCVNAPLVEEHAYRSGLLNALQWASQRAAHAIRRPMCADMEQRAVWHGALGQPQSVPRSKCRHRERPSFAICLRFGELAGCSPQEGRSSLSLALLGTCGSWISQYCAHLFDSPPARHQ